MAMAYRQIQPHSDDSTLLHRDDIARHAHLRPSKSSRRFNRVSSWATSRTLWPAFFWPLALSAALAEVITETEYEGRAPHEVETPSPPAGVAAAVLAPRHIGKPASEPRRSLFFDPPAIDVWYGDEQHFGRLGVPQKWINILGRVRPVDGVASLQYTLNGSSPKTLSVGADGYRLARTGDFNVELEYDGLREGKNLVTLIATDTVGRRAERDVTVHCYRDRTWPLPYAVDWTKVQAISDAVQVVDGNWKLERDGVRSVEPYYDRILAFGDRKWTDYTVTVAVTFHDYRAPRKGPPTYGVSHAAIAARFPGHFADARQPHVQWYPLGAVAEFRLAENLAESSWRIFRDGEPAKQPIALVSSEQQRVELGVRYILKLRVDSQPGPGSRYRVKSWKDGEVEPVAWAMDTTSTGSVVTAGGALVLAHNTDVTFGSLTATPNVSDGR